MPDAPSPITSPPAHPWQPYDATAAGRAEDQTVSGTVYSGSGGSGSQAWPKIQEAGAASAMGEATAGSWPGDGASDGSIWKQT
jgi:hypothetical protein